MGVWLPLNHYRVMIRHKLLSQLGRISHFLIFALNERAFNLKQLATLTALQPVQLLPIYQRLVDLQIIDGEQLSKTGQRYAHYLQFLHGRTASFWLDTHYAGAPVLIGSGHPALAVVPEDAVVVDRAGRSRIGASEESMRQLARIQDADGQYTWLAWLFPPFADTPGAQERWWGEWELDLRVIDQRGDGQGIALSVPVIDAALVGNPAVALCSPLLCLAMRYTVPDGLPASWGVATPVDLDLYFDYFSGQIIETLGSFCEEGDLEIQTSADCSVDDAMAALYQRVLERSSEDAEMALLNRQFSTSAHWRALALTWADIGRRLVECGDNWCARRLDADR